MKRWLHIFFLTLGGLFFILLIILGYLFWADPWDVRPLLQRMYETSNIAPSHDETTAPDNGVQSTESDSAPPPTVTSEQAEALESIGLDPATFLTSLTTEEEACFVTELGSERVEEIKAGDIPTFSEVAIASSCLQ
jgi:hypothetical protein